MKASEIVWLSWFYAYADFGPADEDVRSLLQRQFKQETGLELPEGYDESAEE